VFGAVALLLASQSALGGGGSVCWCPGRRSCCSLADHFVRPGDHRGRRQAAVFLWVLLGILGGVESFGLVGIFLGPALMAALVAVWRSWVTEAVPDSPSP